MKNDKYPLTEFEKYVINTTAGDDNCMCVSTGAEIKGKLDIQRLENAFRQLIKDNDALRINFERDDITNEIYQYLIDDYEFKLELVEVSGSDYDSKLKEIGAVTSPIMESGTGIINNELWHAKLFKLDEDHYFIWICLSHLISDGISNQLIVEKLAKHYNNETIENSESYIDYIKNTHILEKQTNQYTEQMIEDIKGYKDFGNFNDVGKTKSALMNILFQLDFSSLKDFRKQYRVSNFHIMAFVFHLTLSVIYNTNDTIIHIAEGNRNLRNQNSLGCFTITTCSRLSFDYDEKLKDSIAKYRNGFFKSSKNARNFYKNQPLHFAVSYSNYKVADGMKFGECETVMLNPMLYINTEYKDYVKIFCLAVTEMNDLLGLAGCYDHKVFDENFISQMHRIFQDIQFSLLNEDLTFREFFDKYKNTDQENGI